MKNLLKRFTFVILTFALCIPMQITVKAATSINTESKINVEVSKAWTLNFTKAFKSSTVNTNNIKVIGEKNKYSDIKVSLASDNKNLIVRPVKNYEYNKNYTIIVTQRVKTSDGRSIPKEIKLNFKTKKASLVVNVIKPTKKKYKIVLDAGHGGADPGAIGPTGIKEKDIALAITLKVGSILVKNGVETVYTRTSDSIPWSANEGKNLQARCDISNKAKPNYFVSIHENSFTNSSAYGIETYYLTGSYAGKKLAQAVQTELINETRRYDRKIRTTSGLYVIKNMKATSILVETSFISNKIEEKLLATKAYQYKLAKAISTGILKTLGISNIVY